MDLIPTSQGGLYALLAPRDFGVRFLIHLTAQLALEGPVRVLDGDNCFQARTLQRKLRRHGRDVYQAVERVQVARAFTCFQMVALLSEQGTLLAPTLVLDFLATFGDESVSERQRRRLLDQALSHLQRLSRPATVIVSAPPLDPGNDWVQRLVSTADHVWHYDTPPSATQLPLF
jgi:hypothetical protein